MGGRIGSQVVASGTNTIGIHLVQPGDDPKPSARTSSGSASAASSAIEPTRAAAHSARLEFEEQEYTPTRDFEVVCEVDARQSDVVVIPHRRGDDGYFMLQLMPPTDEDNLQRELLPNGVSLELLLLADTSGSMTDTQLSEQRLFIESLLD